MRAAVLLCVAVLAVAGCGGLASRTFTRPQAYRIVAACMRRAGAKSIQSLPGGQGKAAFGPRRIWATNYVEWGYVMSAGRVADVFTTNNLTVDAAGTGQRVNTCLKPHGWSGGGAS